MQKYTPPHYVEERQTAFHCPYCGVFANQYFWNIRALEGPVHESALSVTSLRLSRCNSCDEFSVWATKDQTMVFPNILVVPEPHNEMPADIAADYEEARQIVGASPRGAAALLGLCVQKLMPYLGEKGKNINNDIASLVQKGLPVQIQQALDALRVIGNDSVHPGQINLNDDRETAMMLFDLINVIVDNQIAQPKRIDALYNNLPQSSQDAIKKRDGTT